MRLENILNLLALMDRVVIVDSFDDAIYEGVVEDVPRHYLDLGVSSIAASHDDLGDYLWIELRWRLGE